MRLLPLVLGLVLTGCSCAKTESSIFGNPLFVNGRRVTDDQIKLALIYGPCRPVLDAAKVDMIIEDEIGHQAAEKAGAEIAVRQRLMSELREKYRIRDEEFEAEYTYRVEDFKKCYPALDIGAEICRSYRTIDSYRQELRQTMYFDRVFLPENPDDWPTTTLAALREDKSGGELMIPNVQESYKARAVAAARNNGVMPREDPLLMSFLREMVRNAMFDLIAFKTHPELNDSALALWADSNDDGKPEVSVTVEALWNKALDTVTDTEVSEAKQWFITSAAVRDRLAEDGALLSAAEAKEALVEWKRSFEAQGATPEQMATKSLLFPSLESFSEYYALREGYRRMIASKLAPGPKGELSPGLREILERATLALGLGMVDCEVLLVSAMDIEHFRWKKNGWEEARRKAQALREEYDRDPTPRTWSRLMDSNSDYWDPPLATGPDGKQQVRGDLGHKKKGRFGPRFHHDLAAYVGETPYSEWVTGESITDRVFFDQLEGSVVGPFRGPLGWYLTRVIRRMPPRNSIDPADPKVKSLLEEFYLRWSFNKYTKEAVARAKVRGWSPP